jgi:hypothetical protein
LAFNIENKKAITDAGALPKLVEILYNGGNSLRLEAIIALGTLAHKSAENKVAIVAAGAVNPLVGLLKRSTGAYTCVLFCVSVCGIRGVRLHIPSQAHLIVGYNSHAISYPVCAT